jgi:signal transduction histidine kinase/CheY-like chemotaxis protein
MNALRWLTTLATHQDYFWALAFFGWAATAYVGWRFRNDRMLAWVPWAALAGMLTACIQLSLWITPVIPKPYIPSRLPWDAALGLNSFLLLAGWIWSAANSVRHRFLASAIIVGIFTVALLATREIRPPGWAQAHQSPQQLAEKLKDPSVRSVATVSLSDVEGWQPALIARVSSASRWGDGWALKLALIAAAAVHGWRIRTGSRVNLIALLLAVTAALAGTGPPRLANAAQLPYYWDTQFSIFGPWAALLHLTAASLLLAGFIFEARRRTTEGGDEIFTELRRLAVPAAFWLFCGLLLAMLVSARARQEFEISALGRARAAALVIDRALVARELGPNFQFAEVRVVEPDPVWPRRIAIVADLSSGILHPVENALAAIADANPDVKTVDVSTLHAGLMIRLCDSALFPGLRTNLTVLRASTDADQAAWASKASFFSAPDEPHVGELAQIFSPLVANDGRMLGWLRLSFGASTWHAAQAQARLQAFASVGLGLGLLGVFYQLRMEERRRQRSQLAEITAAEADRAKTALLAKVSHELRTPIQSILGYGELIAQQPLSVDTRRWLESLRSHGQLLTRLVNDLIDLSTMQAGAFRLAPIPGNLGSLVRSTADSLRPRAVAKGLRLECLVPASMDNGHCFDPERVRQVLLNLVNNAIKFTERGQVLIELRSAADLPEGVELRVQDTGPGIAREDQLKLFQPFSRLEAAREIEGAGIGLALSRGLCIAMGGDLQVESDGETGCTFVARLHLPAAELPQANLVTKLSSMLGRRVLVADDNTLVRELFVSCLRTQGAECEAVTDGLAAVERATTQPFDVVVLDLSMPWLDGLEATRRLRQSGAARMRIVGVSAHASAAVRTECLTAGMDAFLVKPVALADLVQAVASEHVQFQPPRSDFPTIENLRVLFAAEVRQLRSEIQAAAAAGDRERLCARIHYLKNSADVARYDALSLHCAQLEAILRAGGEDASRLLTEIDRDLTSLCAPK